MIRALVLSGGGAKGAAQCGALRYILGELKVSYDAFCGISVGALNAAFLAQFTYGEEQKSIDELNKLWQLVETKKIYKRHFPFGRLHGLWLNSFYNSAPLLNWIESGLDINKIRTSGKQVRVGAVSLNTGEYRMFDQNYENFAKAVAASSSYPAMLKPIEMEGQLWSDGGIRHITPLRAAIDLGATEIDIIITSPIADTKPFPVKPNAINVITRTLDLMTDQIISDDLNETIFVNEMVLKGDAPNKRYINLNIIRPNKDLTYDSLDFSPDKLNEMKEIGYNDAKMQYKVML